MSGVHFENLAIVECSSAYAGAARRTAPGCIRWGGFVAVARANTNESPAVELGGRGIELARQPQRLRRRPMIPRIQWLRRAAGILSVALLGGGLAVAVATPAQAVERGQCVVYVNGIFETTAGTNYTAQGRGVCEDARSVTASFLMRYRDWRGWHTAHNVTRVYGTVPDGFDLGWYKVPNAGTSAVYAQATVCYKYGTIRKCRSDNEYRST
jgi:hypothetical protein